jgi:plastocyanin
MTLVATALVGVSACGDDPSDSNNGVTPGEDTGDVTADAGDVGEDTGPDVSDGGPDATDGGMDATDGGMDATDGGMDATDGGMDGGMDATDGGMDGGMDATDGGMDATDGGMDATDGGMDATDGGMDGGADATDGGADATDGGQDATDQCANVTCDAPAPTCDDIDTVRSYSGAGTCDSTDGSCDYSAVEVLTDCATGEECSLGQCIDPTDNSVNAGDLVITEVMQNPAAVNDSDGEYFEVYNTSARTLHLNGLEIKDNGTNTFTVTDPNSTPIELAADSYFVFGVNTATATNGGVSVDYEYSGMSLANGDDELIILNGTTEIDKVEWDGGPNWPDPTGASMQFGSEFDMATNNDGTQWCLSRDEIDPNAASTDLGTPGAANVNCILPTAVISIYDLKDETSANHPTLGQNVDIDGVVATAIDTDGTTVDGIWVQDPSGGERSGVYVDMSAVTTVVNVGDNVDLEGTYGETGWPTYLKTVEATAIAASANGATITPELVDASIFDASTAEAWEGVLIELVEPAVTNENPDAGSGDEEEFRVDGTLRVDDYLFDYNSNVVNPVNCDAFSSLTGVMSYSHGDYKLFPRDAADFPTPTALASSGSTGTVAVASNTFTPGDVCVDNGATVTWTNADTFDHTATERDPVTDAAAATPAFDHTLTATGGSASETFTTAGTFHYLCTIHPSMTGRVIVLE